MPDHLMFGEHMTPAAYDAPIRETYLGQAHIAGTGPSGTTCRECKFWHCWKGKEPVPPGYYGKKHDRNGEIKKALCTRPILNKPRKRIPHDAKSCRLFQPAEHPVPARRPEQ